MATLGAVGNPTHTLIPIKFVFMLAKHCERGVCYCSKLCSYGGVCVIVGSVSLP